MSGTDGASGSQELLFGDLLRRLRRAAGLTQEELGARAGLSVRGLSDLERGVNRAPRRDTVLALSDALSLTPADRGALQAAARRRTPLSVDATDATDAPLLSSTSDAAQRQAAQQGERGELGERALPVGGFLGALPDGPIVAREAEVARLRAMVDAVAGGAGRFVLLVGEPGIGKTRLAQEVTVAARERGFLVATGRCYEPQEAVAYYPFLEALTAVYAAAPAAQREDLPRRWPEVAHLLPDQSVGGALSAAPLKNRDDQQRLFWQLTGFLTALADARPVAVLLDDLHWADSASLDLLAHLARHSRGARILLLGTYRDVEVGRQHPLEAALGDFARDQALERVAVKRLSIAGTRALIAARLDVADAGETESADAFTQLTQVLHNRAEGNPFFTQEMLRALVERGDVFQRDGAWDRSALAQIALPESIRAVIGQRLSRLASPTQDLLRAASVLGQTFAFAELAGMSGQGEEALETALEEAVGAGLIDEAGRDGYIFHHALIQQALIGEIPTRKRRRLHRLAGEALEAQAEGLPEGQRAPRAADLAYHFLEADEGARALPYALQAGDQAMAVYAHAEAERHYRTAAELAAELGDRAREATAREKLGMAIQVLGRDDEALQALEEAIVRYEALNDWEGQTHALGQVVTVHALRGTAEAGVARVQPLLAALEERLAQQDAATEAFTATARQLARLYIGLAALYTFYTHVERLLQVAERAEELARAAHDDVQLGEALHRRAIGLAFTGRLGESLQLSHAAIALYERVGDTQRLAAVHGNVASIHRERGEFALGLPYIEREVQLAEKSGSPRELGYHLGEKFLYDYYQGKWAQARASAVRAVALMAQADRFGASWRSSYPPISLGALDLAEGRDTEGARHLSQGVTLAQSMGDLQIQCWGQQHLAERDLLAGRAEAARARLEPLRDRTAQPDLVELNVTRSVLPLLGWAYLALGWEEQAAATTAASVARAREAECRLGLVDALRVCALFHITHARWGEAEEALQETLALTRAMPYPHAKAKALSVYGQLHAAKGESEQARERYEQALAICDRLGEGLYRPHIEAALAGREP